MADSDDWAWVLPGQHGSPTDVLPRIRVICDQVTDLFDAMFLLLATHQGVPREILATATKQCRSDLAALGRDDIVGLYISIQNGGRQGFDAVLRAKRKDKRSGGGLGVWVKE